MGRTRAGLSQGTWTPAHRETAFCDAGYKKRLSPRLRHTPRSVYQMGSRPTAGSPRWVNWSQLVRCYETERLDVEHTKREVLSVHFVICSVCDNQISAESLWDRCQKHRTAGVQAVSSVFPKMHDSRCSRKQPPGAHRAACAIPSVTQGRDPP